MKKALILTYSKYQDHEVIYPYYRVQEEGFKVDIMADTLGRIHGILGTYMECTRTAVELKNPKTAKSILDEYTLLVIPGGVKALEKLRQETQVLEFINKWNALGKPIACICHGAQLLISAKITEGRDVSGYYSIRDDIENSGANYVDAPAVISKNLVTCPHYKWMGQWMSAAFEIYEDWAYKPPLL
jgi:protease I